MIARRVDAAVRPRGRRGPVAVAAVVAAVVAPTACEPPPTLELVVTHTTAGTDAEVGDGICEVTAGAGDCTVQAAFAEATAHPRVSLTIPAGAYTTNAPRVPVSGLLTVHATGAEGTTPARRLAWPQVAEGGALLVQGGAWAGVDVEGTLVADRAAFKGSVTIASSGTAHLRSSTVHMLDRAVTNLGQATIELSSLRAESSYDTFPVAVVPVRTVAGATTTIRGSVLFVDGDGTPCDGEGALVSEGYNVTNDTGCDALDGPEDTIGSVFGGGTWPGLLVTSPAVDRIPIGVLGCGTQITDDLLGAPRPVDGDGDGTPACDAGAVELPVP